MRTTRHLTIKWTTKSHQITEHRGIEHTHLSPPLGRRIFLRAGFSLPALRALRGASLVLERCGRMGGASAWDKSCGNSVKAQTNSKRIATWKQRKNLQALYDFVAQQFRHPCISINPLIRFCCECPLSTGIILGSFIVVASWGIFVIHSKSHYLWIFSMSIFSDRLLVLWLVAGSNPLMEPFTVNGSVVLPIWQMFVATNHHSTYPLVNEHCYWTAIENGHL